MATSNPIRFALYAAFHDGVVAAGLAPASQARYPGIPFDETVVVEYARIGFTPGDTVAATLGPAPRISRTGLIGITAFVRDGTGEDRCDQILGQQGDMGGSNPGSGILTAFPYAKPLARDGITVNIDVAKSTGAGNAVSGWFSKSFNVYWYAWR